MQLVLVLALACGLSIGCKDTTLDTGSSHPAPFDANPEGLWKGNFAGSATDWPYPLLPGPPNKPPYYPADMPTKPDQIFEGAALSDGELRLMLRGREGNDPLTPFLFYSMRTIELKTQQEERDYRFTDPFNEWLDYNFDDDKWKATLGRRMIANLTQFVPRTAGLRPNMSQGASECTDAGAGADLCTTSIAIDQQNLNPTSVKIAGEFFAAGSADSDLGYGADINPEYDNPSALAPPLLNDPVPPSPAFRPKRWERFLPNSYIDIEPDGTFSGDDQGDNNSDCSYVGAFSIIDPDHNVYRVTMEVANCGDFNGTNYTGLAWIGVDPLTETGTYLFFHVDNGAFVISDQLQP